MIGGYLMEPEAAPRQWAPQSLPPAWLAALQRPKTTVTQPTVPQPTVPQPAPRGWQPAETEPAPPIPSKLLGRVCLLYGFTITEDLIERYNALDFPSIYDYSDTQVRRREHTYYAVHTVAKRMGIIVSIDYPPGHDAIVWFTLANCGIVQVNRAPVASVLERFATELGITEKAEWHDAWLDAHE